MTIHPADHLAHLYGHVIDAGAWDRFGEIYTDDAEWDLRPIGAALYKGLDEIVGFCRNLPRMPEAHVFANEYVAEGDDGAFLVTSKTLIPDAQGQIVFTAVMDTVVRTPDGF